jgi:hypothetical protein
MQNSKAEKLALFRYGLIAPLVIEPLPRGELTRRAAEIASRTYDIPDSRRRALSCGFRRMGIIVLGMGITIPGG